MNLRPGFYHSKRVVYLIAGMVCVLLGFIGALLPVMPTTIFLILAAACFTRSSPRLENWLLTHARFGPSLVQWRRHGVVPTKAKTLAALGMGSGLLVLAYKQQPPWLILMVATLEICVLGYLLSRPSRAPEQQQ